MPGPISSPDAQSFTVALQDPGTEKRVRKIVSRALSDYEWIMQWGTERERLALLKTALPNLLRALNQKDEQAKNEQQKLAYERLREAFRAQIKERTVDGD